MTHEDNGKSWVDIYSLTANLLGENKFVVQSCYYNLIDTNIYFPLFNCTVDTWPICYS